MTTATVLALVRDIVQDDPWSTTLGGAYTAAGTTLTISDFTGLTQGDVFDFQDDATYELMRVATTPTTSTVTISFAYDGTTNANHSNGARFYKNPRFRSNQVIQALTHIVNTRMWPDLWVASTTTLTPSISTTNLYALPTDFLQLLNDNQYLYQAATGSIEDAVYSYGQVRQVPSSIATSTWALRVTSWARTDVGATLFYRAKVTTSNMTAAMEPVIAIGTAAYLLRTEAAEKAERFDEDDRPSRQLRAARELERQFEFEKAKLAKTLSDTYGKPPRRFLRRRWG